MMTSKFTRDMWLEVDRQLCRCSLELFSFLFCFHNPVTFTKLHIKFKNASFWFPFICCCIKWSPSKAYILKPCTVTRKQTKSKTIAIQHDLENRGESRNSRIYGHEKGFQVMIIISTDIWSYQTSLALEEIKTESNCTPLPKLPYGGLFYDFPWLMAQSLHIQQQITFAVGLAGTFVKSRTKFFSTIPSTNMERHIQFSRIFNTTQTPLLNYCRS